MARIPTGTIRSAGWSGQRSSPAVRFAVLVCVLSPWLPAFGSPANSLEYEVKAAMLYNFTRFVEWPTSTWKDARSPLVLAVLGSDPFGGLLEAAMRDKTYAGRPIQVRRFHSLPEVEGCQLLFVSKSEKKHLAEILRLTQAANVVTVSEGEDFVQAGGTIGFVLVENRIRFQINAAAAVQAGFTISSKLLHLAVTAERRGGGD